MRDKSGIATKVGIKSKFSSLDISGRNQIFLIRGMIFLIFCGSMYGIFVLIPGVVDLHRRVLEIKSCIEEEKWGLAKSLIEESLVRQGVKSSIVDLHLETLIHIAETTGAFRDWVNLLQVASRYQSTLYTVQRTSKMYYALTVFYLYARKTIDSKYSINAIENFESLEKLNFKKISEKERRNILEQMVETYMGVGKYQKSWGVLKSVEKMGLNVIVARYWSAVILHAEGSYQNAMDVLQTVIFSQEDLSTLHLSVELLVSMYEKLGFLDRIEMLVEHVDLLERKSKEDVKWAKDFVRKYGVTKMKKRKKGGDRS